MVLFLHMGMLLIIVLAVLCAGSDAGADVYKHESSDGVLYFTNTPYESDSKVVYRDPRSESLNNTAKGKFNDALTKEKFHALAEEKARKYDIDPLLVKAVIRAESNWNHKAVSPKGALGLMQLMPATASYMGVSNPFDPEENIDGGIRYIRYLLEKFDGNLTLALAAYNAGPARVEKTRTVPAIPETVAYVKKVVADYNNNGGRESVSRQKPLSSERVISVIKKFELEDGTIFLTNSYIPSHVESHGL